MNDGISVVICCYNSAARLPETLRHLAAQDAPGLLWEVLVVDNASTDDTAQVAQRCWPAGSTPLRVVSEPQPGLSHARLRGLTEARYEIISFVDDDNWLAPDWLSRVHRIFGEHPEVVGVGGRTEAVSEVTPPRWFPVLQEFYAVGAQHPASGDITDSRGTLLFGAGLSLRTAALIDLYSRGFVSRLSGRLGKTLATGEEAEICIALRASGGHFWYDADLCLEHFIPKERLTWDYARRLQLGLGDSKPVFAAYLLALQTPPFQDYPNWKKSWAFQTLKALWHVIRTGLQHPIASFSTREGEVMGLYQGSNVASLRAFWTHRRNFGVWKEEVRRAAWNAPASRG